MKDSLQRRLIEILAEWELTPTADPLAGFASIVQPVQDSDRRRCALKISNLDAETRGESTTFQLWHGRGAVDLLLRGPSSWRTPPRMARPSPHRRAGRGGVRADRTPLRPTAPARITQAGIVLRPRGRVAKGSWRPRA